MLTNLRSRSAFKLLQVQNQHAFIRPGDVVVDCGAAPGGWTQVATQLARADPRKALGMQKLLGLGSHHIPTASGADSLADEEAVEVWTEKDLVDGRMTKRGLVVSIDLLRMETVPGAILLYPQDFLAPNTLEKVRACLGGRKVDVLMSDMAPNLTGQREADHHKSMELCQSVLEARDILPLKRGGNLLMKLLQGGTEQEFRKRLHEDFRSVKVVKPPASRSESKEIFILGVGYQMPKMTYQYR